MLALWLLACLFVHVHIWSGMGTPILELNDAPELLEGNDFLVFAENMTLVSDQDKEQNPLEEVTFDIKLNNTDEEYPGEIITVGRDEQDLVENTEVVNDTTVADDITLNGEQNVSSSENDSAEIFVTENLTSFDENSTHLLTAFDENSTHLLTDELQTESVQTNSIDEETLTEQVTVISTKHTPSDTLVTEETPREIDREDGAKVILELLARLTKKLEMPPAVLNKYKYITALKSSDGSIYVPLNHQQSTREHLTTLLGFAEEIILTKNALALSNGEISQTDEIDVTETSETTPATDELEESFTADYFTSKTVSYSEQESTENSTSLLNSDVDSATTETNEIIDQFIDLSDTNETDITTDDKQTNSDFENNIYQSNLIETFEDVEEHAIQTSSMLESTEAVKSDNLTTIIDEANESMFINEEYMTDDTEN